MAEQLRLQRMQDARKIADDNWIAGATRQLGLFDRWVVDGQPPPDPHVVHWVVQGAKVALLVVAWLALWIWWPQMTSSIWLATWQYVCLLAACAPVGFMAGVAWVFTFADNPILATPLHYMPHRMRRDNCPYLRSVYIFTSLAGATLVEVVRPSGFGSAAATLLHALALPGTLLSSAYLALVVGFAAFVRIRRGRWPRQDWGWLRKVIVCWVLVTWSAIIQAAIPVAPIPLVGIAAIGLGFCRWACLSAALGMLLVLMFMGGWACYIKLSRLLGCRWLGPPGRVDDDWKAVIVALCGSVVLGIAGEAFAWVSAWRVFPMVDGDRETDAFLTILFACVLPIVVTLAGSSLVMLEVPWLLNFRMWLDGETRLLLWLATVVPAGLLVMVTHFAAVGEDAFSKLGIPMEAVWGAFISDARAARALRGLLRLEWAEGSLVVQHVVLLATMGLWWIGRRLERRCGLRN